MDDEATSNGKPRVRNWSTDPSLFPCELSSEAVALAQKAVRMAVEVWGQRKLQALDAEDRLSVACERGYTEDQVTLALREAFQVRTGVGRCGEGVGKVCGGGDAPAMPGVSPDGTCSSVLLLLFFCLPPTSQYRQCCSSTRL